MAARNHGAARPPEEFVPSEGGPAVEGTRRNTQELEGTRRNSKEHAGTSRGCLVQMLLIRVAHSAPPLFLQLKFLCFYAHTWPRVPGCARTHARVGRVTRDSCLGMAGCALRAALRNSHRPCALAPTTLSLLHRWHDTAHRNNLAPWQFMGQCTNRQI